jgi:hypothetical protein
MINFTGCPTGTCSSLISASVHVLDLPHPLFADDIDFGRVHRGRERSKKTLAPHANITIAIQNGMTVHSNSSARSRESARRPRRRASGIDREHHDERRDEHREERGDRDHEKEDGIDLTRLGRCCFREELKIREHR